MNAHGHMGNRWTLIAQLLPGRTEYAVKTRVNLIKAKENNDMQETNGAMPLGSLFCVCLWACGRAPGCALRHTHDHALRIVCVCVCTAAGGGRLKAPDIRDESAQRHVKRPLAPLTGLTRVSVTQRQSGGLIIDMCKGLKDLSDPSVLKYTHVHNGRENVPVAEELSPHSTAHTNTGTLQVPQLSDDGENHSSKRVKVHRPRRFRSQRLFSVPKV